jgi:catechol 2,3-dioxygenase-like lactoylglutathione lyase family enzyme
MFFHHVQLLTSDLTKQLEFYQDVLDLPVLEKSTNAITLQIGASRLEFVRDARDVFYHFAFNIPSRQFVEAKTWLSERVALIKDSSGNDEFHSQNWNADMFYFDDASGNVVEFIARHDLPSKVVRPFSATSLECVSELGVVTDNVPRTVKQLQALTGASLYCAVMDEMFVPVGDEKGLFIVVKKERVWFPETKAAKAAPFKVVIGSEKLELTHETLGLL